MGVSGYYHPIVVHFALALGLAGVAARLLALTRSAPTKGPTATALLLLAATAAVIAASSGEDASALAEALPGATAAVALHRAWALRARDALVVAAACETLAMGWSRGARAMYLASGVVGVIAALCLVQAGAQGGRLVYAHAAGVGVRSGDPADVGRLLLAGLVQQANQDDRDGHPEDAMALLELAARRFRDDPAVQLLAAAALLRNHKASTALALIDRAPLASDDPMLRRRQGWLRADALEQLGRPDASFDVLRQLAAEFPTDERIRRRLARLHPPPA